MGQREMTEGRRMPLHKGVWIVAEQAKGELHPVSLELLGEGRKLAASLGQDLCAVLLGQGAEVLVDTLARYRADKVYLVEHDLLAEYSTDAYTFALAELIEKQRPSIVMLGATPNGQDLGARMAARLRTGFAGDCVELRLNSEGAPEAVRPAYGDKVYTTVVSCSNPPWIVSLRPGIIGVDEPDESCHAEVIHVRPEIEPDSIRTRVIEFVKADPGTIDIAEAEFIVSGGRGIGGKEQWRLVEELAEVLGASVAGSRVAVDEGWIVRDRQVGQTGKTVTPGLYFALGISGASQHVGGMKDAKQIVAINTDRDAPIFKVSSLSVLADLHQVVPALVQKLREAREKRKLEMAQATECPPGETKSAS